MLSSRFICSYKWLLHEVEDSGLISLRSLSIIRACEIAHSFLSVSVEGSFEDSLRCVNLNPSVADIDRRRRRKDGDGVAATALMNFLHCIDTTSLVHVDATMATVLVALRHFFQTVLHAAVLGNPTSFSATQDMDCLWWVVAVAVKTAGEKLNFGDDKEATGKRPPSR